MRYIFLLVVISMLASELTAQFSIFAKYQPNNIEWQDDWNSYVSADEIYSQSTVLGASYWMKLKEYRVEFHPGISYTSSTSKVNRDQTINNGDGIIFDELSFKGIGIEMPVHIYFLDFEGDCNCPTFAKDGSFLSKGLYFFITPGFNFNTYSVNGSGLDSEPFSREDKDNVLTASTGLGVDIGIGNLITISPYGGIFISPNNNWEGLAYAVGPAASGELTIDRNLRSVFAGIRVSFRPDYVKERRGMFR